MQFLNNVFIEYLWFQLLIPLSVLLALASADRLGGHRHNHQASRQGRQEDSTAVQGGVDFSGCEEDPDTGFCCVEKEETLPTIEKDPILECTHKNVEKCHYTYVTQFTPTQEEVCEENFEKTCQITFKQMAVDETVKKCYKPLEKVCNGEGEETCKTVYESACTTKYVEKTPGKFVGDTKCEKLPIEICGAGCVTEEGEEECHDKTVTTLVDVPEEVCDLNPQKVCKFQTKLVPKLKPSHECTIIPKETCHLKFSPPREVEKPLLTRWCLDPAEAEAGESYDEGDAEGQPLGPDSEGAGDNLGTGSEEDLSVVMPPSADEALPIYGVEQREGRSRNFREGRRQNFRNGRG